MRARDTAYAGTKGALEALMRGWAIELAELGIRVNCVSPGATLLPFVSDGSELAEVQRLAYEAKVKASEPRQQAVLPRDVANAMIFLLSDAAAGITGAVLPVDGGRGMYFFDPNDVRRADAVTQVGTLNRRIEQLMPRKPHPTGAEQPDTNEKPST